MTDEVSWLEILTFEQQLSSCQTTRGGRLLVSARW